MCAQSHPLEETYTYAEVQAFLPRNVNFGKHMAFFVPVTFSHWLVDPVSLHSYLCDLPSKLTKSWHCSRHGPTCRASGRPGCARRGQLSDLRLCSTFSHNLGQLHSTSHVRMIPLPVHSFREPENKGLWALMTWARSTHTQTHINTGDTSPNVYVHTHEWHGAQTQRGTTALSVAEDARAQQCGKWHQ